MIFNF